MNRFRFLTLSALLLIFSGCNQTGQTGNDIDGPDSSVRFDKTSFHFSSEGGDDNAVCTCPITRFVIAEATWDSGEWKYIYTDYSKGLEAGLVTDVVLDEYGGLQDIAGQWFRVRIKDKPDSNELEIHVVQNTTGIPRLLDVVCRIGDNSPGIKIVQD